MHNWPANCHARESFKRREICTTEEKKDSAGFYYIGDHKKWRLSHPQLTSEASAGPGFPSGTACCFYLDWASVSTALAIATVVPYIPPASQPFINLHHLPIPQAISSLNSASSQEIV
jgi:hypothetical protein